MFYGVCLSPMSYIAVCVVHVKHMWSLKLKGSHSVTYLLGSTHIVSFFRAEPWGLLRLRERFDLKNGDRFYEFILCLCEWTLLTTYLNSVSDMHIFPVL